MKVDPRHVGVGMYQHDLSASRLRRAAESVLEECVSFVGVDLNRAPAHVLRRVAGLGDRAAAAIVAHRSEKGRFQSREQLKKVRGLGEVTFRQCAGFVRIFKDEEGDPTWNPLDSLLVHPESYGLANRILKAESFRADQVGSVDLVRHFRSLLGAAPAVAAKLGAVAEVDTVSLILQAFAQEPRHDIRYRDDHK